MSSVDNRPLPVRLSQLECRHGSILAMPFADQTLGSISSLCVLEHIGLGRYGDPLDPDGTNRAAAELQRVLAPGGDLYVSVPIAPKSSVQFNAHRTFAYAEFVRNFPELDLVEATFIQSGEIYDVNALPAIPYNAGMVVGRFHFRRPAPLPSDAHLRS